MYCDVKKLDTFFNESRNAHPIETLVNANDKDKNSDASVSKNGWSFDKDTLMITINIGKDFFL
jgi:hypothetical protein